MIWSMAEPRTDLCMLTKPPARLSTDEFRGSGKANLQVKSKCLCSRDLQAHPTAQADITISAEQAMESSGCAELAGGRELRMSPRQSQPPQVSGMPLAIHACPRAQVQKGALRESKLSQSALRCGIMRAMADAAIASDGSRCLYRRRMLAGLSPRAARSVSHRA